MDLLKNKNYTTSNVYILFKELNGKKYFKVGKADVLDNRINILNKTWGKFDDKSIAFKITNPYFNQPNGLGRYFEKIVLNTLFINGYKIMNNEIYQNNDGYSEFFEFKNDSTPEKIINEIYSYWNNTYETTIFEKIKVNQNNKNKSIKKLSFSGLNPQQITIYHLEYYFELKKQNKLDLWKEQINEKCAFEYNWKIENGFHPKNSHVKSGIKLENLDLVNKFDSIIEKKYELHKQANIKIEKSQNSRTIGYIETFIKSVLNAFNITTNITFEKFLLLLKNIKNSSKFQYLYEEFQTSPQISNKTANRRKNPILWIETQLELFHA